MKEVGIGVSTFHTWIRQSKIDRQGDLQGPLSSSERKELMALLRGLKCVEMERDFLKNCLRTSARPNRRETQKT